MEDGTFQMSWKRFGKESIKKTISRHACSSTEIMGVTDASAVFHLYWSGVQFLYKYQMTCTGRLETWDMSSILVNQDATCEQYLVF